MQWFFFEIHFKWKVGKFVHLARNNELNLIAYTDVYSKNDNLEKIKLVTKPIAKKSKTNRA